MAKLRKNVLGEQHIYYSTDETTLNKMGVAEIVKKEIARAVIRFTLTSGTELRC